MVDKLLLARELEKCLELPENFKNARLKTIIELLRDSSTITDSMLSYFGLNDLKENLQNESDI